jgi:hypothetical protein
VAHGALRVGRRRFLDNRPDSPVGIVDDPTVPTRIIGKGDCQSNGRTRITPPLNQLLEELRGQEGTVSVTHDDVNPGRIGVKERSGLQRCVTGSKLLALLNDLDVARQLGSNEVTTVADHGDNPIDPGAAQRVHDVQNHLPTGEGVKWLWHGRAHAFALARRQNHPGTTRHFSSNAKKGANRHDSDLRRPPRRCSRNRRSDAPVVTLVLGAPASHPALRPRDENRRLSLDQPGPCTWPTTIGASRRQSLTQLNTTMIWSSVR